MEADANVAKTNASQPFYTSNWFWGVLIAGVVVLGVSWILISRSLLSGPGGGDAIVLEPAPVAGHPAPDFELISTDGETIRLSDFKGTPVIVNFWATWCGPCRAEFPDFQQAAVDNADQLVIIGVNNTSVDQAELVPGFLEEFGITFPIVLDEDGSTVKAYRILGLPTTIFIDSSGTVDEVFTGPINKAYIESKITKLRSVLYQPDE